MRGPPTHTCASCLSYKRSVAYATHAPSHSLYYTRTATQPILHTHRHTAYTTHAPSHSLYYTRTDTQPLLHTHGHSQYCTRTVTQLYYTRTVTQLYYTRTVTQPILHTHGHTGSITSCIMPSIIIIIIKPTQALVGKNCL